ncbi:MAG: serine/threonine-protein kinase [Pyrinomonadaceae bacterium]
MSQSVEAGSVVDGKYKIERQLGRGGMGAVYLAIHIGTGRPVAIKLIAQEFMRRKEFVERFRREAKAAGRMRHPNVVDVTDFGFSIDDDGCKTAYLVMEFLDGCTLGEVLEEEESLPLDFAINILEQVGSAVDEAHRNGIIHRDLKPDNIWLEPNPLGGYTVKVLDFGIAKLEESVTVIGADEDGLFLVRDISKSSISVESSDVAGIRETHSIEGNPTAVADGETLALSSEAGTIIAEEAGTKIIQSAKDLTVSEKGKGTEVSPFEADDALTRALPANEEGLTAELQATAIDHAQTITEKNSPVPGTADLTRAGAVLGTPLYMSPEQCRGEKLTPASDIYSLAVIAYQMLEGKPPFSGDYVEVMEGHKEASPPPITKKHVPKKVRKILDSALSKETESRPLTASALANTIRSNSERLGALIQNALIIYSQNLPKILALAVICCLPFVTLTVLKVFLGALIAGGVLDGDLWKILHGAVIPTVTFVVQTISVAILIGMVTWIVGRLYLFPLKPVRIRPAFRQVSKRWKSLSISVFASSFVSILGIGFCIFPGIWLASRYGMVGPSVMMEPVTGRAAFKRAATLYTRSKLLLWGVTSLTFLFPAIITMVIGISIGSFVTMIELKNELSEIKKNGYVPPVNDEKTEETNIRIRPGGSMITTRPKRSDEKRKSMTESGAEAIRQGIFEIVNIPVTILIFSFSSIVSALLYYKLREAGGETLESLYPELDEGEALSSNWERKMRESVIQSGKFLGGSRSIEQ